jgi:hypothetical protein
MRNLSTMSDHSPGLAKVERAFVHVDYEDEHKIGEEHRPLYEKPIPNVSVSKRIRDKFARTKH